MTGTEFFRDDDDDKKSSKKEKGSHFKSVSDAPAKPGAARRGSDHLDGDHTKPPGGTGGPNAGAALTVGTSGEKPGQVRPPLSMQFGTHPFVSNTGAPYAPQHYIAPTANRAYAFSADAAPHVQLSMLPHARIDAPGVAIEPPAAGPKIIPPDRALPRKEHDTLVNDAMQIINSQKGIAHHMWNHKANRDHEDNRGPPPPSLDGTVHVHPKKSKPKVRKEHRTQASEVTEEDRFTFLESMVPKEAHTSVKRPLDCWPVTKEILVMQLDHDSTMAMFIEECSKNKVQTNFNPYTPDGQTGLLHLMSIHGETGVIGDLKIENFQLVNRKWLNECRYHIEFDVGSSRCISKGTYGTVIVAQHRLDGVWYAIKTNLITNAWTEERIDATRSLQEQMHEIFALSGFRESHRHIVRYYSSWVQFDCLYIQTEFCNCGGLDGVLWRFGHNLNGPPGYILNLMRTGQLLAEMLSALSFVHSHNMVHMDVKPHNIMVQLVGAELPPFVPVSNRLEVLESVLALSPFTHSNNKPVSRVVFKLGDFGHCRIATVEDDLDDGDAKYMPPDGMNAGSHGHPNAQKVDIFSLGLSVAEAGGAHIPAKLDADVDDIRKNIIESGTLPTVPALEVADEFSDTIKEILLEMIKPSHEERPEAHTILTRPGMIEYFDDRARMESVVPLPNDGTTIVNHASDPATPYIQPRIGTGAVIHHGPE